MALLTRPRALTLLLLIALVGCAGGGGGQSGAAATASPATATEGPAATAATATQPAATEAPAAAEPPAAVAEPTLVASPIPPAAAAEPFPLEAGWWDNAVCYEVFVRSFYDSDGDGVGDLNGLIERLDYINDGDPAAQSDLGASCIWLMPIAEATSYHGYDTVDYYSVEQDYGSNDDFKRLVEEAHARGIQVVIDLVINHTSVDHPWFQEALRDPASPFREYYIWADEDPGYRGPWGDVAWHKSPVADEYYYGIFWSGMPDLNYRNPAVTAEAQRISDFWLNEMGVDGFRLDAIKHLIEDGQVQEHTPETLAWLRGYRQFLQEAAPGSFTVGEIFDATPAILAPYYPDQLDSYFIFDLSERLVAAAGTGNARPFVSATERITAGLPFQRFATFLTNHDQDRVIGMLGEDPERAKLAAVGLLTIPGMPFVYYGEEIGMVGVKPDERIRTPMQWSGEANGGFSAAEPWQPLQPNAAEVNVAAQNDDPGSLLNTYRRLIHLHAAEPALARGDFSPLEPSDRSVAAYLRQVDGEAVLVLINFGGDSAPGLTLDGAETTLPAGSYRLEPLYGEGAAAELTVGANGAIVGYAPLAELPARSAYIFKLVQE